jgi:hypothetical protein
VALTATLELKARTVLTVLTASVDCVTAAFSAAAAVCNFPALADKIDKGYTVKQLLSPYLQTRANILEEDADTIDLKQLQSVAKDPKGLMGLYDYEVSLRKDPKWKTTKNALDTMSGLARDMTKMFGLGA